MAADQRDKEIPLFSLVATLLQPTIKIESKIAFCADELVPSILVVLTFPFLPPSKQLLHLGTFCGRTICSCTAPYPTLADLFLSWWLTCSPTLIGSYAGARMNIDRFLSSGCSCPQGGAGNLVSFFCWRYSRAGLSNNSARPFL